MGSVMKRQLLGFVFWALGFSLFACEDPSLSSEQWCIFSGGIWNSSIQLCQCADVTCGEGIFCIEMDKSLYCANYHGGISTANDEPENNDENITNETPENTGDEADDENSETPENTGNDVDDESSETPENTGNEADDESSETPENTGDNENNEPPDSGENDELPGDPEKTPDSDTPVEHSGEGEMNNGEE